jgi:hypothetical protein
MKGEANQAFNIRGARPTNLPTPGSPLHVNFLLTHYTYARHLWTVYRGGLLDNCAHVAARIIRSGSPSPCVGQEMPHRARRRCRRCRGYDGLGSQRASRALCPSCCGSPSGGFLPRTHDRFIPRTDAFRAMDGQEAFAVIASLVNHWVQATLDCACQLFLSQWPSAPDPARQGNA